MSKSNRPKKLQSDGKSKAVLEGISNEVLTVNQQAFSDFNEAHASKDTFSNWGYFRMISTRAEV